MSARWRDATLPDALENSQYDADHHQRMRRNYAAMIENIDRLVGEYVDWLAAAGQLDNTIIIYSSDHGDNLGDHDKWHKTTPHQASVSVPLICAGPGIVHATVGTPVDLVDVAATLVDFVQTDANHAVSGTSLRSVLAGGKLDREFLTVGFSEWRMITDGRQKYVHNYDPAWSAKTRAEQRWHLDANALAILTDLYDDPSELVNRAKSSPQLCRRLHEALLREIG